MNKLLQFFFLLSLALTATIWPGSDARASHYSGSDVTFTYTGVPGFYLLRLQVYRDCGGIDFSNQQISVTGVSSCGGTATTTLTKNNLYTDAGALEVCPGQNTECTGNSSVPGIELKIYEGVIPLAPCASWVFTFTGNARNDDIINLNNGNTGGINWYTDAMINTLPGINNSSPFFSASPVPYVCLNQVIDYNPQVTDPNGDSLVYSLVGARGAGGVLVPYTPGYSATQPFGSATSAPANPVPTTINSVTGQMTFQAMVPSGPTNNGYVVVIRVEEWRKINGVPTLVGFIHRDVQVNVLACNTPAPTLGDLTLSGNGLNTTYPATVVQELQACVPYCISIPGLTTNPNVLLSISSNAVNEVPNSTFVVTGQNTQNPVGNLCFNPNPNLAGQTFSFTVEVRDNACPIPNKIIRAIQIKVMKETGYTAQASSTSICAGDTVQLSATALANTVPLSSSVYTSLSWTAVAPSGAPINGQFLNNSSTTLTPQVAPIQTTTYRLNRTTIHGCSDVASVTVVVNGIQPTIQSVSAANNTLCLGQSTAINTVVTGPDNAPNPTWTYSWTPAVGLSSTTAANPVVSYANANQVTYTVTVSNGTCSATDTVQINFVPEAIVNTSLMPAQVCIGETIQLSASSSGPGAAGGVTYSWIAGGRIDVPTDSVTTAMPDTLGTNTYVVEITTSLGCTVIDTLTVEAVGVGVFIDSLTATSTSLCTGSTVKIDPITISYDSIITTPPTVIYDWTPGTYLSDSTVAEPFVTGPGIDTTITYTLTILNGNCSDSKTITFNFVEEIFVTTSANPNSVCVGDTVNLETLVTPSGINGVDFTWSGRGINAVNSNTTFAIPDTIGTLTYQVIAQLGVGMGCQKIDSVTITVSGVRPVITSLSASPPSICFGETSTLSAVVASSVASFPNPGFTYTWSPVAGIQGDNSGLTAIANPVSTTTYEFVASDNGSCEVLGTIDLPVGAEVQNSFSLLYSTTDTLAQPPVTITFQNQSITTGQIDSIKWVINNLDLPMNPPIVLYGMNPSYTFTEPNQYQVVMTVYTPNGPMTACAYPQTKIFRVGGLLVPNVITPNGDGINDAFVLPALKAGSKVQIFNRWGKRVKEFGPGGSWAPGTEVPAGVYYYLIEENNPTERFKGWLEILR